MSSKRKERAGERLAEPEATDDPVDAEATDAPILEVREMVAWEGSATAERDAEPFPGQALPAPGPEVWIPSTRNEHEDSPSPDDRRIEVSAPADAPTPAPDAVDDELEDAGPDLQEPRTRQRRGLLRRRPRETDADPLEEEAEAAPDGQLDAQEPRRQRRGLLRRRPRDAEEVKAWPERDELGEPPLPDPPEDAPAVACAELVKQFGEGETSVLALRGISLEFERRTFSAIMGPSGSGKSTLMHLLAGLDAPTSGTVSIGGVSLAGLSDRKRTALRRVRVGFVFQAFNLLPVLSAQENIELPLRVAGARADPYWVEELLRAFDLTDRRAHRPAELSGGQQQRVAIARALVTQPDVVFADEPTGNIDSAAGEQVLGILERCVREYGQTVVMVTHDPLAAAHAARVVFLADGEIVRDEQAPSTRRILDVLRDRS